MFIKCKLLDSTEILVHDHTVHGVFNRLCIARQSKAVPLLERLKPHVGVVRAKILRSRGEVEHHRDGCTPGALVARSVEVARERWPPKLPDV
jgi:hypothetical protein